jgi:hypothetical protein
MRRQEYTTEFLSVPDENGWSLEANCVDVTFYNYGTCPLIINNVVTLQQNEFINIAGNTGEIDKSKYICSYQGSGTKNAIIIKRNYK